MRLNRRLITFALVIGAALATILAPGRGTTLAVEETPAPLPPPVTPTPGVMPGSLIATPVFVQPGQPNPPRGPICQAALGAYPGGLIFDSLNLRFTLPAGGTYNVNFGIADPGGEFVRICYVEGDAAIFFGRDGRERSRIIGPTGSAATANPVLDEIARNVQLLPPPPTPQPPPAPSCPSGSPGGRTVETINGVTVDLPPGDYAVFFSPASDSINSTFGVCYVQGNARVSMLVRTCAETSRTATTPEAHAVLDSIVRSCKVPTPEPALQQPSVPIRSPIRPPDTGDAGLIDS